MRSHQSRRQAHVRYVQRRLAHPAVALCAVIPVFVGCDSVNDTGNTTPDRVTLGASVQDDTTAADDLTTTHAGIDDSPGALWISAQPVFCCNPLAIDFEAASTELDLGTGVRYEWNFGDGRTGAGRTVQYTFPWSGEYSVQLTAYLPGGGIERTLLTLSVGDAIEGAGVDTPPAPPSDDPAPDPPAPDPPTDPEQSGGGDIASSLAADAGSDFDVSAGMTVMLDGSASGGTNTEPVLFTWEQIDGPPVALADPMQPTVTFAAPDAQASPVLLVFQLTVTQGTVSSTDEVQVRVLPSATPPVMADAGADQQVTAGDIVELNGAGSGGNGTDPIEYHWIHLSGPTVILSSPYEASATFEAPPVAEGSVTITFELTVTQGEVWDTDSVQVVVVPESAEPPDADAQILHWLRALPPLPKVHYAWPFSSDFLDEGDEALLYEYIRIARAACVWGKWVRQDQFEKVAAICRRVNEEGDQAAPATIAVLFRPWTRVFPPNAPPTYVGPEHDEEVRLLDERLTLIKTWVDELGYDVQVSAVIFENERFTVRSEDEPDHEAWNLAIDVKHNAAYDVAKRVFPDAVVEWYARGLSQLFTLREKGESFSVPLYHVPELDVTRTTFRRAVDAAESHGVSEVTPWVALGSAYERQPDGSKVWRYDNDYDVSHSWQIGAEINDPWYGERPDEFAPWSASRVVVFWPPPFDERVPSWPEHFVAYVCGAHGITELP